MTPDFYEDYLQHQITQAKAKRVVDEFLEGIGTPLTFEDLHLQSVGEVGEFTAMIQERINRAFGGVGDRLFEKVAKPVQCEPAPDGPWKKSVLAAADEAAAAAKDEPCKIKLSDIRDFSNG